MTYKLYLMNMSDFKKLKAVTEKCLQVIVTAILCIFYSVEHFNVFNKRKHTLTCVTAHINSLYFTHITFVLNCSFTVSVLKVIIL